MNIKRFLIIASFLVTLLACSDNASDGNNNGEILGYSLLEELPGHWIGNNETPFGGFDWFAFDFRPISSSHVHSIYEGATNQTIINSFFIADFDGQLRILGRNGGWLGPQYRATYFVMDKAEIESDRKYYRLVDAVGGVKRSYMEFTFENGNFDFKAYKDNSGALDEPILHMHFVGQNINPSYSENAISNFSYPQMESEKNFNDGFTNLIDNDSALYLDESSDPFPRSEHTYLSTLNINFSRKGNALDKKLLFYISKESLVSELGEVNLTNIDKTVIRTITIQDIENFYKADYLHPDTYYLTAFADIDGNFYPSENDISSESIIVEVTSNNSITAPELDINIEIN